MGSAGFAGFGSGGGAPGVYAPYSFGLAELPSLLSLRLCGGYDGLGFIASDGLLPSFPMMG